MSDARAVAYLERPDGADQVRAVVVAVPAHDEERRIVRCLLSLLAAVDALAASSPGRRIDVSIVIASDRSTDDTDSLIGAIAALDRSVSLVRGSWGSAGAARRAAVAHGLAEIGPEGDELDAVWIATTDADSEVPTDWLVRQLHHAESGCDAVAGIVEILDDQDRTQQVADVYATTYLFGTESHVHVHGANLGVRASAYLAAGGFPAIAVAEDHGLWDQLRRRRFRTVSPVDVRVFTSGRLVGRAPGGFADTMSACVAQLRPEVEQVVAT